MTEPDRGDLATRLDADNPWPGPEAFRQEDSKFFFGRDKARDALTRLVLQNRLVLLYGRSGLGKTSLLRAGVFPRLEDAFTLPIHIRLHFGASAETDAPPDLLLQIKTAIDAAVARAHADGPSLDPAATLWEWFYRADAQFFNERSRRVRPVLVFDQFEEAFTHGRATPALAASTDRFLDQLIDLIRGSVPAQVVERLEQDTSRVLDFASDRDACGVLLAIRQEFLAELLRLRPRLPQLLDHRFELSGMTLEDAEAVVVGPGAHLIEPGVEKVISRFVAAARRNTDDLVADDTTVDPAILSIFCRELNNTRRLREMPRITAGLVEGVQAEIIADFYRRSVADLPADVRSFIEEQLVTPSGYRNNVAWDQAVRDPDVEKAIGPLVERRLIRVEGVPPRARIELTHDVLTEPIVQSRNLRRVQEAAARAREAEEQARAAAATEAQRQRERAELVAKRQALRNLSAVVFVLIVLLIGVGVLMFKTARAQNTALRRLSFARVEQGLGVAAAGRTDRGLAYVAKAIRDDPDNVTARSLLLDAVLHRDWALPVAQVLDSAAASSAAFGAHDSTVVTVAGGLARRWGLNGQVIQEFADGTRASAVAVRGSDDRLATGDAEGVLRIWRDRDPLRIQAHSGPIVQLTFDQSGTRIATASVDGTAAVWNADSGAELMRLPGHTDTVQSAQFSPDGQSLVTASRDGRALVWDIRAKRPRIRFPLVHTSAVVAAQFSPDGTRIITASEDKHAHIWEAQKGAQIGEPIEHDAPLVSAAFSPDGQRIMTATADRVSFWTIDGEPALEPLQVETGLAVAAFASDGRHLLTSTLDGTTTVWDVRRGAAVPLGRRAPCDRGAVLTFARRPDEVAIACPDSGRIDLWDIAASQPRSSETNAAWRGVTAIDFNATPARVLALNGGEATLSRMGSSTALPLQRDGYVHDARLSPDGRLAATAGEKGAAVWDAETGRLLTSVAENTTSRSIHFSSDGARIITASDNGFAEIWDARSGNRAGPAFPLGAQNERPDAQINADGTRVVVTSKRGVTLFDARDGKRIAELRVPESRLERTPAVFNPAGDLLVTLDTRVRLWDAETGSLVATLREPSPPVSARFSPDGKRLVTAHAEGFRIWDGEPEGQTGRQTGQPQSRLIASDDFSGMGPVDTDGRRTVTLTGDGFLRVWDFPIGTRDDGSIARLVELMIGYRCNDRGAVEPIEGWIDELAGQRKAAGRADAITAWALADRDDRTISPFTTVTKEEYIQERLKSRDTDALREARRLFPWDPRLKD